MLEFGCCTGWWFGFGFGKKGKEELYVGEMMGYREESNKRKETNQIYSEPVSKVKGKNKCTVN